uniref:Venom protein family 4 protein 1 n=1 Tax=Platymeris rhadamanthus TaxID=1134088 RepID=A0A6B9L1C2_PLARH|nr:venom protein family 4 protein 1 [Platymeris rhadamanthus]
MYLLRVALLLTLAVSAFAEMKNCSVQKSKVDYEVHVRQCCERVVGYPICVKAETDLISWKQGKPAGHVDSGTLTVTVDGDPIMKMAFSADSSKVLLNNREECTNNMYFGKVCLRMKRVIPKDWHKGGIGICYTLKIPRHEQFARSKCIYLNFKEFIDLPIKQHLLDN